MKTNNEQFIKVQLFAEQEGASTPTTDTTPSTPSVDYESEYKKLQVEVEKYKRLKDDYAKESAGYKKQLADRMTDDEKNAQAQKEFEERMANLEAENRQMKLEKSLLANGFTTEESEKLIKANISISDMKVLTDIIKEKVEMAVKSAKAELIKDTTPSSPMGDGTTKDAQDKTDFQKFQESQKQKTNRVEI